MAMEASEMNRTGPIVLRIAEGTQPPGEQTPGMERRQLLDHGDRWVGWVRTEPGVASAWHHHADRDTYVFITEGAISIDYGPGGLEAIAVATGDVAFIPARTVHREVTSADSAAQAFVVRIGTGPQNVNVDGPE
jgi:uncharacterized RmlC-like cupin family protein